MSAAVDQVTIQQYCKALRTSTIGGQSAAMAEQTQREEHTDARYLEALLAMEIEERERNPVTMRCCQYLNNVREQDHRRVKGRLRPMLGFKTFYNARRVIIGIELAQKIHKRQFATPTTRQSNPAVIWRHVMAA